jgi:hypothetical protein
VGRTGELDNSDSVCNISALRGGRAERERVERETFIEFDNSREEKRDFLR